jgi:hypothetical protein
MKFRTHDGLAAQEALHRVQERILGYRLDQEAVCAGADGLGGNLQVVALRKHENARLRQLDPNGT